jgi:hypothetical protein
MAYAGTIHLDGSAYGIVNQTPIAHVRREGNESTSYCERLIIGPVPEGGWKNKAGYHIGQHCVECTQGFADEHENQCPVTFEF